MYPRKLLVVIALAAFLGSLVLFAPARALLRFLPEGSPLKSAQVSGRLLDGELRTASASPAAWRWQVQPGWLLTLGLAGTWEVVHPDFRGSGRFVIRPWHHALTVTRGELSAARLGRLFGNSNGVELDQPLLLVDVQASGGMGRLLRGVEGRLGWGGGTARLRNRESPLPVPALRGQLTTTDGVVALVVDGETAPGVPWATAAFDLASREMHVVVLGRAANTLGLAGERPVSPDASFFEVRQTLQ